LYNPNFKGVEFDTFKKEVSEAEEFGEAAVQILESKRYEYEFSDPKYQLDDTSSKQFIISKSKTTTRDIIAPENFIGTLELNIKRTDKNLKYQLVVLKTKFDTEDNTAKCTELLMQENSPDSQYFEPDFSKDNKTI
tara:strand:+ start:122 stop:529 length:408 start_codon:yes stop_codon:yes gene_type:complete